MRGQDASQASEDLITTLVTYFASQSDVVAVYLFGSVAEGRARATSDIDLAVLLRSDLDGTTRWTRRLRMWAEVEEVSRCCVDLVILNDAPPLLQHQVLKCGRLLFQRDQKARVEFEVQVGKTIADLRPMYDFFTEALLQEIKEVGLGGSRRRRTGTAALSAERGGLPETGA